MTRLLHIHSLVFSSLIFLLSSCVSISAPKNNVGFANITGFQQLVGCYKNLAENVRGSQPRYLSGIIFRGLYSKSTHTKIDIIRVAPTSGNALKVTGESEGQILAERTVIEGKDFTIESGKIILRSKWIGPGNIFIAVAHESSTLGLDEHGDGKLEEFSVFAGTGLIVIPIAGLENNSYRFNRISEPCIVKHEEIHGLDKLPESRAEELAISRNKELEELGGGDCSRKSAMVGAENYYRRGKILMYLNDYKPAMTCFVQAQEIEKNTSISQKSCSEIGLMYELGWGVEKDKAAAEEWYKKAGF